MGVLKRVKKTRMGVSVDLAINRFYFLRHGQTESNRSQVFHADESIGLTDLGQSQADRAATALLGLPISAIVSSPYHRVQRTIAPYLAQVGDIAHAQNSDLAERSFAGLDGKRFRDIVGEDASDQSWEKFWHQRHEGVEPLPDFNARVLRGMQSHLTKDNMLIAAHGGVLVSIVDSLGLTLAGTSHKNAHPILFTRSSATAKWQAAKWNWGTDQFDYWC